MPGRDGLALVGCAAAVRCPLHTDREIKAIRPDGCRRLYAITGVSGLRLDVRETGTMTWVLKYRTRSRQQRTIKLGRYPGVTLGEARKKARQIRGLVDTGRDPQAERKQAVLHEMQAKRQAELGSVTTIKALALRALGLTDFPARAEPIVMREKSLKECRRLARAEIIPTFGNRQAATLRREEIIEWSQKIKARPAPYTANRAFALLQRIFRWGIQKNLLEATPFILIEKPAEERPSMRVLSTDEVRFVCRALRILSRRSLSDAMWLLLLSGVRRDMVREMRRSELEGIDSDEPRWLIPGGFEGRTKSGRDHLVPLSRQAVKIIKRRLFEADGDMLFPSEKTKGEAIWWNSRYVATLKAIAERLRKKTAKRKGLATPQPMPRWTVHNLRHTVATHMAEDLKVPRHVISLILGHAVGASAVTRIYDRSDLLPERRDALDRWALWLDGLTRRAAAVTVTRAR